MTSLAGGDSHSWLVVFVDALNALPLRYDTGVTGERTRGTLIPGGRDGGCGTRGVSQECETKAGVSTMSSFSRMAFHHTTGNVATPGEQVPILSPARDV